MVADKAKPVIQSNADPSSTFPSLASQENGGQTWTSFFFFMKRRNSIGWKRRRSGVAGLTARKTCKLLGSSIYRAEFAGTIANGQFVLFSSRTMVISSLHNPEAMKSRLDTERPHSQGFRLLLYGRVNCNSCLMISILIPWHFFLGEL